MISKQKILHFPITLASNNALATDSTDMSGLRWLSVFRKGQHISEPSFGFPGLSLYQELLDSDTLTPLLLVYKLTINRFCPRFYVRAIKVVRKKTQDREYRRGVILEVTVATSDKAGTQIVQGLDLSEL